MMLKTLVQFIYLFIMLYGNAFSLDSFSFQCAPDEMFDFIMIEDEGGPKLVSAVRSDQNMAREVAVTNMLNKLTYPNPTINCQELLKAKSCLPKLNYFKAWASITYFDSILKGGMDPHQFGGLLEFYEDFHFYLAKDPTSAIFKTALTKNVKQLTDNYIKEDQESFINSFIQGCKEDKMRYYMLENNELMQSIIKIKKLNSRYIDIFRNLAADGGLMDELFEPEFEDALVKIVASYKAQAKLSSLYYALILNLQKQMRYCEK